MSYYKNSKRTSQDSMNYGVRTRNVNWPEGAPDPQDVPHAGAEVRVSIYSKDNKYTVINGIPHKSKDTWNIQIVGELIAGGYTHMVSIAHISPWHEDTEPCYTEEQIREASRSACNVESVIAQLKRDDCG